VSENPIDGTGPKTHKVQTIYYGRVLSTFTDNGWTEKVIFIGRVKGQDG
jgi:hypothetical protein